MPAALVAAAEIIEVSGFQRALGGSSQMYHAPLPQDTEALLARARGDFPAIEWETAALPTGSDGEQVRYTWAFGISINSAGHGFRLFLNDRELLMFRSPANNRLKEWSVDGADGSRLDFRPTLVDIHGNLQGFASLSVPRKAVADGLAARLRVKGEPNQANAFYMTFKAPVENKSVIRQRPVILRGGDSSPPAFLATLELVSLGRSGRSSVAIEGILSQEFDLKPGVNLIDLAIPHDRGPGRHTAHIRFSDGTSEDVPVVIEPVPEWTVDLVQHTHTDIGYTRPQIEILPEHLRYIDYALDYCDQTDGLPDDARFRWTCESSWAVREYLHSRPPAQIERLQRRVAEGRIELAGMFFNMSELAGESGLVALMQPLAAIRAHGMPVRTAMQNDVNGIGWALAEHFPDLGIKYLVMGEHNHRALLPFEIPTAFWWESPSGKRTLAYRAEHYMFGNKLGVGTTGLDSFAPKLLDYLSRLAAAGYPFRRTAIQHSGVFTDNSPPSTAVCELAEQWNRRFLWPRLRVATTGEFMEFLEQHHAEELPVHRVAWPDWWTDGFGSAARETAASRLTAGALAAREGLLAMARASGAELPASLPAELRHIRESLLFYDEHTFGAAESISDPLAENTMIQWAQKGSYVWEAVKRAGMLTETAMGFLQPALPVRKAPVITVFNTLNWPRDGVVRVFIDHELLDPGRPFRIEDASGNRIEAQRLESRSEGTWWAIMARAVPANGFTSYLVRTGGPADPQREAPPPFPGVMENLHYRISFDPENHIKSIFDKELDRELLEQDPEWKAGQLIHERLGNRHQLERFTLEQCERTAVARMEVTGHRSGPLWDTLLLRGQAPDTADHRGVEVELRLHHATKRIEWIYQLHKLPVTDPEGLYVAFPFALPGARLQFEAQGAMIEPGAGQLEGTASDWNTVQSVVSVSNGNAAIHWSSPEIPLVHFGGLNIGRFAYHTTVAKPAVFSWVLNNYWTTNFRASQEGALRWTYLLGSSADSSPAAATRFGWAGRIPLEARVLPPGKPRGELIGGSLLHLNHPGLLLVNSTLADDGSDILLHLREIQGAPAILAAASLLPPDRPAKVTVADATGHPLERQPAEIRFAPFETKFLRVSARP